MASTSLQLNYTVVDVFTHNRYEGNPLAIVEVPKSATLSQDQKQIIAREFNFSETTFLHEPEAGTKTWTVDIFMTTQELPFAGHPTIGTAFYVLSQLARESEEQGEVQARFKLKAGPVQLRYNIAKNIASAEIPHDVHIHKVTWPRDELLRLQPRLAEGYSNGRVILNTNFPVVSIVKGMTFVLIELESVEALALLSTTSRGVSISGLDKGWDSTFVGAYFFTRTGTEQDGTVALRTRMIEGTIEDPATGSAASDLAAYLSLMQGAPGQVFKYAITQGVEMGRRSDISVDVIMGQQSRIEKVVLGGGAVEVMQGQLSI